jgi:class 3 adenylate cyclase/DNA-binding XRE family transcriptional regulator
MWEVAMREGSSFGAWLKRRRKALDLTQADLARLVGCAVVSIRKLEADEQRPSRQTALRLAQHLQIPLEQQVTFVQFARLGLDEAPPTLPIPAAAQLPETPPPTQRAVGLATQPAARAASAQPSGTVTFLFSDIEGSTDLWEHTPEAMRLALARHNQIVSDTIAAAGGYVYKTIGDAFQAAFATAPQALAAALAVQQALYTEVWITPRPLRVRMAQHTGVTEEKEGDYAGPLLNRVARLLTAGHGGQILLSAATHELVWDQVPPGITLRDLGVHQLKDLIRPEPIFQLLAQDLPAEFPPLRSIAAQTTILPHPATPFIGRAAELAELAALLDDPTCRLLTLTGPGGIGKTRLALALAAERLGHYPHGVWFVNPGPTQFGRQRGLYHRRYLQAECAESRRPEGGGVQLSARESAAAPSG